MGYTLINAPEPCYLFEVQLDPPNLEYLWGEVTQEVSGQPTENWQVPYDEQPLDESGNRWAFFFHYLNSNQPLITPEGTITIPEPTSIPEHLTGIEYEAP